MKNLWIKRGLALLGAAFSFSAAAAPLPAPFAAMLSQSNLPADGVGLWVAPARGGAPVLALNEAKRFTPASTMKVVTTGAALLQLGANYTWKTRFLADRAPDAGGKIGTLYISSNGDPHRVSETVWLLAQRLRASGVKTIAGDVVLDRSAFDEKPADQAEFDGAETRSYNVGADALLTNFQSVSVLFTPVPEGGYAAVSVLPPLAGFRIPERVPLSAGACGDWKKALKARFSENGVSVAGAYPARCGEKAWHYAKWDADRYLGKVLAGAFASAGIVWKGKAVSGRVPENALLLFVHESEPLTQIVTYINKFSNNPMARQLFLTLSFADEKGESAPASRGRSARVIGSWLTELGVNAGEVQLENGSGLSRTAYATPRAMGLVLQKMFMSPCAAEFVSSLPMAGVDGTMKKRALSSGGSAHLKTGYLAHARSVAGYITDINGARWAIVLLVNAKNPDAAKALGDSVVSAIGAGALSKANSK